jgi:hypothetical protein
MYTLFDLHSLVLGFFSPLITVFCPILSNPRPKRARLDHLIEFLTTSVSVISHSPATDRCHLIGHDFYFPSILILEASQATSICIHVSHTRVTVLILFHSIPSTQTSRSWWLACMCTLAGRAVHKKRSSFTIQLYISY